MKNLFNVPAYPAATVILMRDKNNFFEVLLLKRNSKLDFHGGHWVFPGGRIDQVDYQKAAPQNDEITAAKFAAARETFEESGLSIKTKDLVLMSQWTTPPGYPKRFKTWFFLSCAPKGQVKIDNQEIKDFQWYSPEKALDANNQKIIHLPVPTYYTLESLTSFSSSQEALTHYSLNQPVNYG
ncbi:NUDIX hydrolase [Candidatus Magnetomorum sp. HK-1]|nr:NUDIX hydrolase [Candidatus Magnetomorum sp. HK-1]